MSRVATVTVESVVSEEEETEEEEEEEESEEESEEEEVKPEFDKLPKGVSVVEGETVLVKFSLKEG